MKRWRNLICIAVVFLSVCTLATAVVSASQSGLPGDRAYPVKLTIERLRVSLAGNDVARARLRLEFLGTRLNELDHVLDSPNASPAFQELKTALVGATKAVAALQGDKLGDLRAQLAGLALLAAAPLERWQAAGGDDPGIDYLLRLVGAVGEASANPKASGANLLLLLDQVPAGKGVSEPVKIAARSVQLPADLVAVHKPPFTGKHAEIYCNQCHIAGKTVSLSSACNACHEDVHVNRFERAGYDCAGCHNDVAFKPATIDHERLPICQNCHTVVAPQNHFAGECSNCHTTKVWKPANFDHTGFTDCASCHADRTPAGHFEGQCSTCHNTKVWKPATFNHTGFTDCASCHADRTPAGHFEGQCSTCHSTKVWKPSTFNHTGFTDCASCHADRTPAKHYPGQCSTCHTTTDWKPANFNHTGFTDCASCHANSTPAKHYAGQCSTCHTTTAWKPANFNHPGFTDCASCHADRTPAKHYAGQCSTCHTTTAWKPANFNHAGFTDCASCHADRTPAKHYAGQCSTCHRTIAWKPANLNHAGLTDCASCHANRKPANHYPGQCSTCHNTTAFKPANFNHTFPLNHGNANRQCATCHPGGDTRSWTCTNCHKQSGVDSEHRQVRSYSANCIACHANGTKPRN